MDRLYDISQEWPELQVEPLRTDIADNLLAKKLIPGEDPVPVLEILKHPVAEAVRGDG